MIQCASIYYLLSATSVCLNTITSVCNYHLLGQKCSQNKFECSKGSNNHNIILSPLKGKGTLFQIHLPQTPADRFQLEFGASGNYSTDTVEQLNFGSKINKTEAKLIATIKLHLRKFNAVGNKSGSGKRVM